MKKKILCIIVSLTALFVVYQCIRMNSHEDSKTDEVSYPEDYIYIPDTLFMEYTELFVDNQEYTATITSIGDIMLHSWQINRGYDSNTDTFDYAEEFTYVTDYLSQADFTVANLETTFAGRYNGIKQDVHGYSDYPYFNAPEVLAQNIKDAGIDLVGTANNHSLDSGQAGVYSTLDYLDEAGLLHTGSARSEEEKNSLCLVDVNGITFGFCAYTYSLNGFALASDQLYSVNTLKNYSPEKISEMCQEVQQLKAAGADFVLVLLHAGIEYQELENSTQDELADKLIAAGADVILGSHPHVIEPMDIRSVENEDGSYRTCVILYSQGNFVSSQKYKNGMMKDIGMITDITFVKKGKERSITQVAVAPTYTYWNSDVIGVVPVLEVYNNRDKYSFLSSSDWSRIEDSYNKTISTLTHYGNLEYTSDGYRYTITRINE
jgi:poly-gamma-glutamate synthesis protein (capsule biosynthesis protein)